MVDNYDIIVVGAGHAGCEAASAAATLGSKVLLVTMDMTRIAQMSCNPAMGGIAKGQMLREIDALGGQTGLVTDETLIQFRMLNRSKGPAMWSPRAQCDRIMFSIAWRTKLENNSNIDIWQDTVKSLLIKGKSVEGVVTGLGREIRSRAVILTNGTFINGLIHIGRNHQEGGRLAEPASKGISEQLKELGFIVGRMKTGTPARLDGRSIDFKVLEEQKGDKEGGCFSYLSDVELINRKNDRSCFITNTNEQVHNILEKGFKDSPLYNGTINGIGPRYCPSIEDKIITFAHKDHHQLFLEPESNVNNEYYLNGFSSSLPWNIQYEAIRRIKGLENVVMHRPGYAIEYDYYDPTQLFHTLETKNIFNLFFAGQINGTTGYEEAGAQGIVAGINAHLRIRDLEAFVLKRDEAYIGVLVDDLVMKGVDEPYRMFTSRAEYRILLRQDNADERLTERSYRIGLAGDKRLKKMYGKRIFIEAAKKYIKGNSFEPKMINPYLLTLNSSEIKQKVRIWDILLRPEVSINDILKEKLINMSSISVEDNISKDWIDILEVEIKYAGYIEREKGIADKIGRLDDLQIVENFDYKKVHSISTEAKQKLARIRPKTIGQASRIPGVSPSDINVLLIHIGR